MQIKKVVESGGIGGITGVFGVKSVEWVGIREGLERVFHKRNAGETALGKGAWERTPERERLRGVDFDRGESPAGEPPSMAPAPGSRGQNAGTEFGVASHWGTVRRMKETRIRSPVTSV